jgi:hypothetical protein
LFCRLQMQGGCHLKTNIVPYKGKHFKVFLTTEPFENKLGWNFPLIPVNQMFLFGVSIRKKFEHLTIMKFGSQRLEIWLISNCWCIIIELFHTRLNLLVSMGYCVNRNDGRHNGFNNRNINKMLFSDTTRVWKYQRGN